MVYYTTTNKVEQHNNPNSLHLRSSQHPKRKAKAMPRLDEHTQQTLRDAEQGIRRTTATAWDSFSNFALRDNVLEVAVGLILAASFTACANALVSDIFLPLISLLPFLSRTLDVKFLALQYGPNANATISNGYNTPQQAVDDGAVVLAYGHFLDKIVRFGMVALALWVVAIAYARCSGENIVKRQVKCRFCRKYISEKAVRCVNCTSWVDGREGRGQ
ncbi:large-conductance mechanosensitive channel [Pyrenophora seminiperda CCB06]|uniref:Large-conductance mechanosensitive channel n=1 Tax=Pyrenophora seminiperda CCB06 TaxID=1302712 RepID=A0A3M7MGR9_9PLEO|nr:large-conductance mechanosensitive channel [Pyrenophora seminiperda CCB06]